MIQEIAPEVYDNAYRNIMPGDDSYIMMFSGGDVWAREDGDIDLPCYRDVCSFVNGYTYLFSISGDTFFLGSEFSEEDLEKAGYERINVSFRRHISPRHKYFAVETAWQLERWYRSNRYCGACGAEMKKDEKERMLRCPVCGSMVYPKICPAVIVGVLNGDSIAVTRYKGAPPESFALVAGFSEIGESAEDTVRREVMEEIGVRVKNIRFYRSQPWSFTDTLLLGFFCDVDGDDCLKPDGNELSFAEWRKRKDIKKRPDTTSLTSEMIEMFGNGAEC